MDAEVCVRKEAGNDAGAEIATHVVQLCEDMDRLEDIMRIHPQTLL